MVFACLHGYGTDQNKLAELDLGKRRFEEYTKARRMHLRGQPIPPDAHGDQNNLPLRKSNNRNWTDEARFVTTNPLLPDHAIQSS